MKKFLKTLMAAVILTSSIASAQQLLPTNGRLHEDLNWLVNRNVIQMNLSTWPLSAGEIQYALDNAKPQSIDEVEMIERLRQYVNKDNQKFKMSAELQTERPLLPIGMNQPTDEYTLSAGGHFNARNFDLNVQGNMVGGDTLGRSRRANLAGSYAALNIGNQWLSVGQQSRFWGPAHEGSLILGDAARPFTALNLQRNVQKPFESKYLSWLGKWNYQIFVGQLSNKDNMKSPSHTKIMGMRVTVSPTDYLDFGLSRTAQWGGRGRPQDWSALWNAIIARDNADTADERRREPGNQLAGVDVKLKLQPLLGVPISVYGQMVGEDEANHLPSKNFFLVGVDGSHKISDKQTLNWHLEGADTSTKLGKMTNVTYRHHIYKDGYTQQNMPLGHNLGGDMRSVVLGVNTSVYHTDKSKMFKTHHFGGKLIHAQTVRKNKAKQERYNGVAFSWEADLNTKKDRNISVGANGWYTKPQKGKAQSGVGLKTSMSF